MNEMNEECCYIDASAIDKVLPAPPQIAAVLHFMIHKQAPLT